ncbi:MAG TPA: radical SAM protein [Smithella sp.]|nr:radical SAM protein [Smithella sp.]
MSMKILLINPWIYDFAAYDFWIKPLGLLYIGGLLRKNHHEIDLIDCLDPYHPDMRARYGSTLKRRAYGDGKFFRQIIEKPESLKLIPKSYCRYGVAPDIFRKDLRAHKDAGLVLVSSAMTYWYPGVFDAIKIIREEMPGIPVVLGGKYATLCRDHAVKFSGADVVISGAGERQILEYLEARFGEKPTFMPDEENLDALPYPAFDLIRNPDQLPVATSRGCPYRCSYCASPVLYKKFLRRDPERAADEIEHWQKTLNVVNFSFYDDALLAEPQTMIIPLLKALRKRRLKCQFHCPNGLHLRNISQELSDLLYESGFKTIRFGFETADPTRQTQTGGKVKNEELIRAVTCLKKSGYRSADIGIYILCGMPNQSAREVQQSVDFVLQSGAKPILAEYSPIPGTKMWGESAAHSPFDILNEPLYHNNSLLPCAGEHFSYAAYREIKKKIREAELPH